ncbi:MAG: class E sortase [Actinobacteria bacterium]|nr:MAG: class E sortase [Actinomycetota bacterium]TML79493.1 MAG: class E sortase [Actinomycetota bacterium]
MHRRVGWIRPVLRFVASVLITSGILMLADAGLTLAWQEPVSAFFAAREQGRLAHKLDVEAAGVVARDKLLVASIRDVKRRLARLGAIERKRARAGDPIGRIKLPTLGRHYVVVQGTDTDTLRKGPGHYPSTVFPGEPGTVAIAGHRTTYGAPFRTIDQLKAGQHIVLAMPYGTFSYAVERTQIVSPDAFWITHRVPGEDRLVLSACHPLYSASHRIVVFARLIAEVP